MLDVTRRYTWKKYLAGDGVEIGALYRPFDLTGAAVTRIRYVDRFPEDLLRQHYPELAPYPLVPIDIIDDGQVLGTVPDDSLDFIIANHMIEHCDNPLGTIENWLARLRVGGVIFMALPDQRVGWDEQRAVTSLAHIVEDYQDGADARRARNYDHYREWVELAGKRPGDLAEVDRMIAIDYSIHFHVFTFDSFRDMLTHARDRLHFPLEILDFQEPVEESWESIFILRKVEPVQPLRAELATLRAAYAAQSAWAASLEPFARRVRDRNLAQKVAAKLLRM